jgi:hypothetical protein
MTFKQTTNGYRAAAATYLFIVYAFGVFSKSAWSDDFPSLLDPDSVAQHAARDGRVVYGLLIHLLFSHFNTVGSLFVLRLIGLIGLILLNDSLIKKLSKIDFPTKYIIASTFAFTLPSFQFTSHWAVTFIFGWAALFAVAGYNLITQNSLSKKVLGFLFFVTSILLYPLLTFFLFSFIYFLWSARGQSYKPLFIQTLTGMSIMMVASILSYAVSYFYLRVNELSFNARVSIVNIDQIPDKLLFFISRPFVMAYRPFLIDSPSFISAVFVTVFSLSILAFLVWTKNRSILKTLYDLLIFNFFLALSIAPLLVVSQNQIDMRFVASNTWLFTSIISLLIFEFIENLENRFPLMRRYLLFLVPISLLSIGAVTINVNFLSFFHGPYNQKEYFFNQQISKCSSSQLQSGFYIVPRGIPWPKRSYIGAYSQTTDLESSWVPIGALTNYLKDNNLPIGVKPVYGTVEGDSTKCDIKLDGYPGR